MKTHWLNHIILILKKIKDTLIDKIDMKDMIDKVVMVTIDNMTDIIPIPIPITIHTIPLIITIAPAPTKFKEVNHQPQNY